MSGQVAVVTDSTAALPADVLDKYDVTVVIHPGVTATVKVWVVRP